MTNWETNLKVEIQFKVTFVRFTEERYKCAIWDIFFSSPRMPGRAWSQTTAIPWPSWECTRSGSRSSQTLEEVTRETAPRPAAPGASGAALRNSGCTRSPRCGTSFPKSSRYRDKAKTFKRSIKTWIYIEFYVCEFFWRFFRDLFSTAKNTADVGIRWCSEKRL